MGAEVVWLPDAVEDVERLRQFILEKNPLAAARAAKRIKDATALLSDNPEHGRPVDALPSFRDIYIPFGTGSYVLRYGIQAGGQTTRVVVVRIWHSREQRI